jgi:predicted acylesterase/phospholipase RssA
VRVLALGGGGLRAAFQVPILEALLSARSYDLIMGISAGAVNGVYITADDVGHALAVRRDLEAASSD